MPTPSSVTASRIAPCSSSATVTATLVARACLTTLVSASLHDAVHRVLDDRRGPAVRAAPLVGEVRIQVDVEAGRLPDALDEPLERRRRAELVQGGGTQVGDEGAAARRWRRRSGRPPLSST